MNAQSKTLINLLRGWPHPDLLPAARLKPATTAALSDNAISTAGLEYGPDDGYYPLRDQVAQLLTSFYTPKEAVSPDRICITGGASQSLACILQVFSDPLYTRNVWMVAPAYFLACRIFEDSGFAGRLRAVPEDSEGIDVDFLAHHMKKSEEKAKEEGNLTPKLKPPRPWRHVYKHLIYAVPTFANPSSRIMSLLRREQLVRLARQYDALIVTDDVYDFLQWSASPSACSESSSKTYLPRIVDVDRFLDGGPGPESFGNAVSNGSFSKIIGPGVRSGWVEGTGKLAWGTSQAGSSRSGGAPSQLTSTFLHQLLQSGSFDTHLHKTLIPAYSSRYHTTLRAIETHLVPLGVTMIRPSRDVAGGYFVWLTLPSGLDAQEVAEYAKSEENLIVAAGSLFRVQGDEDGAGMRFERDIRICYAWEDEGKLSEGIKRLAHVIRRVVDGNLGEKTNTEGTRSEPSDVGSYQ